MKSALTEEGVKLSGASSNALNLLAFLHDGHARLEAHRLDFGCGLVYLLSLLLGDALDVEHLLLGAIADFKTECNLPHKHSHHSAYTSSLELADISSIDAVLLELVNLVEGWLTVVVISGRADLSIFILKYLLLNLSLLLLLCLFHSIFVKYTIIKS